MTDCEKVLVQISEFVFTEMSGVKSVKHITEEGDKKKASFVIITDCEKEFVVNIKEMK